MSKTKHTETPYRIEPFLDGAEDGGSVDEGFSLMANDSEEPLAIIGLTTYRYHSRYRADYSGEEKKTSLEVDTANAEFIVRACNCHDELVAVVNKCEAFMDDTICDAGSGYGVNAQDLADCASACRAILTKAKDPQ